MAEEGTIPLTTPVAPEVLEALLGIQDSKATLGLDMLSLEKRKVALLGMEHKLSEQERRIFEQLFARYGLAIGTKISIDPQTRLIRVDSVPGGNKP